MKSFRVACLAVNPKLGEVAANRETVLTWTRKAAAAGARLALFPEAFLSGYALGLLARSAVTQDSEDLRAIRTTAAQLGVVVSIGFFERAPEGVYLSQAYLGQSQSLIYRKCHLTAGEKKACVAGAVLDVQKLGFACLGTQICYDSAFPRATETLVRKGAEILFTPTAHAYAWPPQEKRNYAAVIRQRQAHVGKYWRARAYDYSCYSIYVDNVGMTRRGAWFPGYIGVFGPDGEVVAENTSGEETMVLADLDGKHLATCRKSWIGHYQALADSRPDLYLAR